jgi:hypothetical protein
MWAAVSPCSPGADVGGAGTVRCGCRRMSSVSTAEHAELHSCKHAAMHALALVNRRACRDAKRRRGAPPWRGIRAEGTRAASRGCRCGCLGRPLAVRPDVSTRACVCLCVFVCLCACVRAGERVACRCTLQPLHAARDWRSVPSCMACCTKAAAVATLHRVLLHGRRASTRRAAPLARAAPSPPPSAAHKHTHTHTHKHTRVPHSRAHKHTQVPHRALSVSAFGSAAPMDADRRAKRPSRGVRDGARGGVLGVLTLGVGLPEGSGKARRAGERAGWRGGRASARV